MVHEQVLRNLLCVSDVVSAQVGQRVNREHIHSTIKETIEQTQSISWRIESVSSSQSHLFHMLWHFILIELLGYVVSIIVNHVCEVLEGTLLQVLLHWRFSSLEFFKECSKMITSCFATS